EVDVAGLFEPAPDGLRGRVVVFVRGADEPVEGRAEGALGVAEVLRVVIGEFLGCDAELVRSLQHLQPVLIRAGAEEDLVIVQSFEPGDRVGRNVLIGVPDVNGPVRVGNRCRQVVTHRPFSLRDTPLPARTGPLGTRGDPVGRRAGAIRREWWGGPQERSAESGGAGRRSDPPRARSATVSSGSIPSSRSWSAPSTVVAATGPLTRADGDHTAASIRAPVRTASA